MQITFLKSVRLQGNDRHPPPLLRSTVFTRISSFITLWKWNLETVCASRKLDAETGWEKGGSPGGDCLLPVRVVCSAVLCRCQLI